MAKKSETDKLSPKYKNRLRIVRDIVNGTGDNQIVNLAPQDVEALEQSGAKVSCVKDENGKELEGQFYGKDLRSALEKSGMEDVEPAPPGIPAPMNAVEESKPHKPNLPKKS